MGQVIALVSGKGGVGKTTITACLGAALSKDGHQVLLTDGDLGLRDLDLVLGKENDIVFDASDVCKDKEYMDAAIINIKNHLDFLPASQSERWEDQGRKKYRKMIKRLAKVYDYVLIDAPAGIGRGCDTILDVADRIIVVTHPLWVSLRNVGRVMQICHEKRQFDYALVINSMSHVSQKELDVNNIMTTVGAEKLASIFPYTQDVLTYTQEGRLHELSNPSFASMMEPLLTFVETGDVVDEDELCHLYESTQDFTPVEDEFKEEVPTEDKLKEDKLEEDKPKEDKPEEEAFIDLEKQVPIEKAELVEENNVLENANFEEERNTDITLDEKSMEDLTSHEEISLSYKPWTSRVFSPISRLLHRQKGFINWRNPMRRR